MKPVLYLGCPPSERAETEQLLAVADLAIVWADNVGAALGELQRRDMPVLLDLSRGTPALQVARDLRSERPDLLMFAVVDSRRPELTTEAVLTGVADVFARPPAARRLASAIEREMRYESLQPLPASVVVTGGTGRAAGHPASIASVPDVADDALYSHAPSMRDVVTLIGQATTMFKAGVMIQGEDGSGRQVVARAIHAAHSARAPFVSVDCAASEADGLDVELFGSVARPSGSERGAAGLERIGRQSRLHAAIGGTLYLKNIADASTRVQGRLARLLRDREAVLAETGATIAFDVRPMAGANPGIDAAVAEGRVRDELFRRLSAIRIDMPPLRSRREDIPALANYLLRGICGARRIPPKTLSRAALALMAALPWRGNAVELRAVLERSVAGTEDGQGIGLDDILAHVRLDGGLAAFAETGTLREARARFERQYIAHVLEQNRGRISEAAKALGIQRTNLYRKLRALRADK